MSAALRFDAVTLRYGERAALADVSLAVEPHRTLSLMGPSGCGKSSLLRLALGLVAPTEGQVLIHDQVASGPGRIVVPPERRGFSVVFQELALWPHLTVEGHLRFVLAARKIAKHEQTPRIEAMLTKVSLADRARSYPAALSGGERQRLAIARALVGEPSVVLLDEPLSNLDLGLRRELLTMFRRLFEECAATVVYVTHDIREAHELGGKLAVMHRGAIVAVGTLDELKDSQHSAVRETIAGLTWRTGEPPGHRGR